MEEDAHEPVRSLSALSLLALVAMLSPTGASAADKDAMPRKIGDWTLAVSEDGDGCFLTRIYDRPGDTTLLLGLDRDGSNHLTVLNANWSIKPKERLSLDFKLTSGGYPKHFAVGLATDEKQDSSPASKSRSRPISPSRWRSTSHVATCRSNACRWRVAGLRSQRFGTVWRR